MTAHHHHDLGKHWASTHEHGTQTSLIGSEWGKVSISTHLLSSRHRDQDTKVWNREIGMLIHVRQHRGRDVYGRLVVERRKGRSGKFVGEFSQATSASLRPVPASSFHSIMKKGSPDTLILSPAFPKLPSMEHKSHKIFYHKRVPWASDLGQCPETQYILTSCKTFLIVTKKCLKSLFRKK